MNNQEYVSEPRTRVHFQSSQKDAVLQGINIAKGEPFTAVQRTISTVAKAPVRTSCGPIATCPLSVIPPVRGRLADPIYSATYPVKNLVGSADAGAVSVIPARVVVRQDAAVGHACRTRNSGQRNSGQIG